MKKIALILLAISLFACAEFSDVMHTVSDVAHTLCMIAASERTNAERANQPDDSWCIAHAKDYLSEVMKAKAAANRKAGIAK